MFEYKIGDYRVKEAEQKMNEMAKEGWRVVTFTPNVLRRYAPFLFW